MTFGASTRSVWILDIGVRLLDPAVLSYKGVQGWDAIDTGALIHLRDAGPASARDCPFHCMQRAYESVHVAYIDPMILAGRQRAPGQEVNIGTLAPDEQDSFPGLDAGMNFRRQYIADEGVAQRD